MIRCQEPINNQATVSSCSLHIKWSWEDLGLLWIQGLIFKPKGTWVISTTALRNIQMCPNCIFGIQAEALIRLELCMCPWQLLLRPTRRMGKTPTAGSNMLLLPLYSVCVYPHIPSNLMAYIAHRHTTYEHRHTRIARNGLSKGKRCQRIMKVQCYLFFLLIQNISLL